MRRRRRVVGCLQLPPEGPPAAADGVAVVLALVVVATAVVARSTAADKTGDWSPTSFDDSVMHNVSAMIARLLDNYDPRLRPQFGGRQQAIKGLVANSTP